MEAYNTSSSSSSSASSGMYLTQYPKQLIDQKPTQSFHASLHSIRKPQLKPWKKPIAPLPPTPPRVYKVDPVNFRDIVQKLTGSAAQYSGGIQPQQQRLHSVAPPPLDVAAARTTALFGREICATPPEAAAAHSQLLLNNPSSENLTWSAFHQDLDSKCNKTADGTVMASSSLELNLLSSPSSYNWCSFPLLSPGTISSLEQSTVL